MTADEKRRLELYRAECESLPDINDLLEEQRMAERRQLRELAEQNKDEMTLELWHMKRGNL